MFLTFALILSSVVLHCNGNDSVHIYNACPNRVYSSEPMSVMIYQCKHNPCKLRRETIVSGIATFHSHKTSKSARLRAHIQPGIFPLGSHINVNACLREYSLKCPIRANTTNNFSARLRIPHLVPKGKYQVHFELTGDRNSLLHCWDMDVVMQ